MVRVAGSDPERLQFFPDLAALVVCLLHASSKFPPCLTMVTGTDIVQCVGTTGSREHMTLLFSNGESISFGFNLQGD